MPALETLDEDALLRLDTRSLTVEPRGRLLVRNACMIFDRHLGGTDRAPGFSRVI